MVKQFQPEGPRDADIMIVGEALGQQENAKGLPFQGASGKELTEMLSDAGIEREDCYLTNVFWRHPLENKLERWCQTKKQADAEGLNLPALKSGKYIQRKWYEDVRPGDLEVLGFTVPCENVIQRLKAEVEMVKPKIILALGNTPCWALLGQTKITKIRGTLVEAGDDVPCAVMPTFHPAYVLRVWNHRPVVLSDMQKAREYISGGAEQPECYVHIEPTFDDLSEWEALIEAGEEISYDIETRGGQITCIGFAPNPQNSYVIPFIADVPTKSYWPTHEQEVYAWKMVKRLCELPNAHLAQNGTYDMQYLWHLLGIRIGGRIDDTMHLHHGIQPEMKKDLGFLGSIYTNHSAWKNLRKPAESGLKRDD